MKQNEQSQSPSNAYNPFQNKNKVIIIVSFDCYQKWIYSGLYNIIKYEVASAHFIKSTIAIYTTRLNLYLRFILKIMNNDKTNLSIRKQHYTSSTFTFCGMKVLNEKRQL